MFKDSHPQPLPWLHKMSYSRNKIIVLTKKKNREILKVQ